MGRKNPKSGVNSSAASSCCGAETFRANGLWWNGKSSVSGGNCTNESARRNSGSGSKKRNTVTGSWKSCSHQNKTTRKSKGGTKTNGGESNTSSESAEACHFRLTPLN